MALNSQVYCYDGQKSFNLVKWKIRKGSQLFYNTVILSYTDENKSVDGKEPQLKYKSNIGGTVIELIPSEGDTVQTGDQLLKVQPCTHQVIMKDLCAECGADLRHLDRDNFEKLTAATTFSMVHVVPELKVSLEQAEKLGRDDEDRLLKTKKLVLLVDLDQTLIHTTNDNVPLNLKDVYHFQLYGSLSPWYHTKLRPGTEAFLENISKYYELHICTFGARLYAHKIAKILDPDGKYFSHRILSRDECFDATSKTGNLKALFPRGEQMVCIIDDREDVWNFAHNVVHVKPFCFFRNTGDINSALLPPLMNPRMEYQAPVPANALQSYVQCTSLPMEHISTQLVPTEDTKNLPTPESAEQSPTAPHNTDSEEPVIAQNETVINDPPVCQHAAEVEDLTVGQNITATPALADKSDTPAESSSTELTNREDNTERCNPVPNCALQRNAADFESAALEEDKNSQTVKPNDTESKGLEISEKIEITDDYLLYLEEILVGIHKEYYSRYDKLKSSGESGIPDLKIVVPQVRRQVLKAVRMVFSSVIPTNGVPENHHLWTLAESMGASVSLELEFSKRERRTTHVVASKQGTAKVNEARRHKGVHVVCLDWLLCCAERWERVDERLFPLDRDAAEGESAAAVKLKPRARGKRHHSSKSKRHDKELREQEQFCERIFIEAGLSLSREDIEDMDREIVEACSEESDNENANRSSSSDSSSSAESLSSGDYPRGWKKRRKCERDVEDMTGTDSSDVGTIGSVDEEIADAVKQEFGNF